jgi:hypothetical protein
MADVVLLEWTFAPADLFEERCELQCDGYHFLIESGRAESRVPVEGDPGDCWSGFRNEMHQRLDALFLGAQILTHQAYTLSKPNLSRLRSDGGIDRYVYPETLTMKLSAGTLDVRTTDDAGNIVRDTRRERIDRRNDLAQNAAACITDPVANSILRSYAAAVKDPANELIHLYEIRDCLAERFEGTREALGEIGIDDDSPWRRLGQLANAEPLIQGRHRGQHLGVLREATSGELTEARNIARALIGAYLAYSRESQG